MKLTRSQEQFLVNYGLNCLLNGAGMMAHQPRRKAKTVTPTKKKRRWSKAQREKFAKSMAKVWRKKKAGTHGQTV